MKIDIEIRKAIKKAVAEEGQEDGVAKKLIAWFEAVASGNEELDDVDVVHRHLEIIFGEMSVNVGDDD